MERYIKPEDKITGKDILRSASNRLRGHLFEQVSDEENLWFSYHVTRWLLESFSDGTNRLYAEGLDYDTLPSQIMQLIKDSPSHSSDYVDGSSVLAELNDQLTEVAPAIPGWEQLSRGKSQSEIVEAIIASPDTLSQINPGVIKFSHGLKVSFEHGNPENMGLVFHLTETDITPIPFGTKDSTEAVYNFCKKHAEHYSMLTQTAAQLAYLAAQEMDKLDDKLHHYDRLEQINRRLGRAEIITQSSSGGGDVAQLPPDPRRQVIKELRRQGHLKAPGS